ncbi:hypothetical protein C8034_v011479 [Colletotrichum sidae]|uniref:Uncharacterized protein n=1 Tax=Colletotrichum sidae TaxID=1347389 RepID=A0A4R8TJ34_9PEZI|nr:hypothetical protein C8034_v011479 [Colletotrichum sidae]
MGCVFDVYVNEWLPPPCYDRAVAEKSESNTTDLYPAATGRTTFPLYWDVAMSEPATLKDVMLAAFDNVDSSSPTEFYLAWEYHRAHCLHLWRLAVSALRRLDSGEESVGVYYKSADPEHAWHCNKIVIMGDTRGVDDITSLAPGIGRCTMLGRV